MKICSKRRKDGLDGLEECTFYEMTPTPDCLDQWLLRVETSVACYKTKPHNQTGSTKFQQCT